MNTFQKWVANGNRLPYGSSEGVPNAAGTLPRQPPIVQMPISTILCRDIEAAIGAPLTNQHCLDYIRGLDALDILDSEEIIERLVQLLPLPPHISEQSATPEILYAWLHPIVGTAVMLWIDAALLPALDDASSTTKKQIQLRRGRTTTRVANSKKKIIRHELSVVITCHNYARFLAACLRSVYNSTLKGIQVIVVDDDSDDDPKAVCAAFPNVQYMRCDVRSSYRATAAGMPHVKGKYVCFLDADDIVLPGYFAEAMSLFDADHNVVLTSPILQCFGGASGVAWDTDKTPEIITIDDMVQRNWVSSGAVFRTTAVRQSHALVIRPNDDRKCPLQDWHIARNVLNFSMSWYGVKMVTPLMRRVHGLNKSVLSNLTHWEESDFSNELITIVIAFSGRWDCWGQLLDWLNTQTWPQHQLRLMIINTTRAPLSTKMLGLEDWGGSIQIERLDVGRDGLADEDRRLSCATVDAVEIAVTAIYNTAARMLTTEYVVFLEDDIIPQQLDTVERLLQHMGPWTAGVTGVYQQRYHLENTCAFNFLTSDSLELLPLLGRSVDDSLELLPLIGRGVEKVDGSGFGCLLTRRSLLRRFPLVTDGEAKYYDCQFSMDCKTADNGAWVWLLNRSVQCDHVLERGTIKEPQAVKQ